MAKNLVNGTATNVIENGDNISIGIKFPIGYIYLSTSSTNPSAYFGGTWQRISNGKVLVGVDENDTDFNAPNLTGGEKTHTLTVDEIPSHAHGQLAVSNPNSGGPGIRGTYNGQEGTGMSRYSTNTQTETTGGGKAHNNLQPYFTCYIWEKVGE